jgi:hypothetical protein
MVCSAKYRVDFTRLIILLLYVLASMTIGCAHRPLRISSAPDLVQFALPDGTIPPICGQDGTDSHGGDGGKHVDICDACCLTHAPGLSSVLTLGLRLPMATTIAIRTPSQKSEQPFSTVGSLGARGPPLS